jgi:FHA domain-containing protein
MSFWCDEQIVVHVNGPEGEREIVVARPMARIGSHPDSEIVLAGPGIAKRAIYLHATPDGVYALNLDLEHAQRNERGRWLTGTEPLIVGPYRLAVRAASGRMARPSIADLVASRGAPSSTPVVNIFCERRLKDKRRFRSALSILGSRPQCSLRLRGRKVSSFHCALYWQECHLWCIDLLSSNGTSLNGERLECGEVRLNDRLDVGEFGLVYDRWSPRRSALPGWERQFSDRLEPPDAASSSGEGLPTDMIFSAPFSLQVDQVANSPGSALQTAEFSSAWKAERQPLREELAVEVARLEHERQVQQRDWEQANQQLATQLSEVQHKAARLTEQLDALEAARRDWHQERDALTERLDEQSRQIEQLEAELASTAAVLAQRVTNIERYVSFRPADLDEAARSVVRSRLIPLPAEPQDLVGISDPDAVRRNGHSLLHDTTLERHSESEFDAKAISEVHPQVRDPKPRQQPSELEISNDDRGASPEYAGQPERTLMGTVTEEVVGNESEADIATVGPDLPRRRHQDQAELTSFVNNRLLEIADANRGRAGFVWSAVGIAGVTLAAVALGIWSWLH